MKKHLIESLIIILAIAAVLFIKIGETPIGIHSSAFVPQIPDDVLKKVLYEVSSAEQSKIPEHESANIEIPDDLNSPFIRLLNVFDGEASIESSCSEKYKKTKWLGLFTNENDHSLKRVDVDFGNVQTDETSGDWLPLKFSNSQNAVFIFTDHGDLKPTKVKTLFVRNNNERNDRNLTTDSLGLEDQRKFSLNSVNYLLRVTAGTSTEGQKRQNLILENNGEHQVIYNKNDLGLGGSLGELDWVGDIDDDGKLDLLFSYFAQNGGHLKSILFVSSQAQPGQLVKPYAFYSARLSGCE